MAKEADVRLLRPLYPRPRSHLLPGHEDLDASNSTKIDLRLLLQRSPREPPKLSTYDYS